MDVTVRPGRLNGRLLVPGSKAIAQRALILATRRGGTVRNVPESEDLNRLCAGLGALGYEVGGAGGTRTVAGEASDEDASLDLGDNATGARCLLALAALRPAWTTVDGSTRLRERPVAPLCAALRELGAEVQGDAFPVRVKGPIRGGTIRLTTELSSQFATALVLLVERVKGLRVHVSGSRSFSYVGLTAFVQRAFRDPFDVEPDFSSAAALMVAAATSGGDLLVEGLSISSPQPDARIVGHLNRAGARVTGEEGGIRVRGGPLTGIRADLASCPDLAPVLGAMGALAKGTTVVAGAPHLRLKESDRIAAVVDLVRALGGDAAPEPDGFRVRGGLPLSGTVVSARGDHRVAMAAGVLALSVPGVTVAGAEAVRKSYPRYFEDLAALTE
jgi:3-phosphoshikimate 1-carboxyvinyltransferase